MKIVRKKVNENIELIIKGLCIIAIVAAIIGLFGYGIYSEVNRPTEGIIISKDYEAAHTETVYKRVKVKDDYIRVPTDKVIAERYVITIKGINKKGKEVKYSFNVPAQEYNSVEIGELYTLEGK